MKLNLSDIPRTLLLPLWGRAEMTRRGNPVLEDPKAVEVLSRLDHDFTAIKRALSVTTNVQWIARARQLDRLLSRYIEKHPSCTVVNIGAGFDTTFFRVDNGSIRWFDLDLPHVIAIRRQLIAETERSTCLACSLFNPEWMSEIGTADRGLFIHAAGVFFYFNEQDIREFFFGLHDRLAGAHIAFDAMRRLALRGTNWVLRKSDVKGVTTKWGLDDPSDMEAWDCGVSVIEWVPLFSGIPRTGFDLWTRALMWANDRFNVAIIVHCSV